MDTRKAVDTSRFLALAKAALFGAAGLGAHQALAWAFAGVPWILGPSAAAAVVVAFAAAWYYKGRVQDEVLGYYRGVRTRLDRLQLEAQEINGLTRLTGYSAAMPMPFGGGWALRGDSAAVLVRELLIRKPEVIVELGSGVSTLLAAQVVARIGSGKVYSIDHDEHWLNETRRMLEAAGVAEHVELLFAPLEEQTFGERVARWYRLPEAVRTLERIDFLFVDGPPGRPTRDLAITVLGERLSRSGAIFFDDVDDPAMPLFPSVFDPLRADWRVTHLKVGDGIAILTRKEFADRRPA